MILRMRDIAKTPTTYGRTTSSSRRFLASIFTKEIPSCDPQKNTITHSFIHIEDVRAYSSYKI